MRLNLVPIITLDNPSGVMDAANYRANVPAL